jgi:hypothetical protein
MGVVKGYARSLDFMVALAGGRDPNSPDTTQDR